jgi:TolB-like protein
MPATPANGLMLGAPAHGESSYPISTRVAITEFKVSGDETSRTLAMRLQDGFVVGLTRTAPLYVLDSIDVARYVDTLPELQKCDGAICIKRLGQELDVSHVVRVSVTVTGNSYDMTARLFRTQGPSPADVPVDTQARFCPVCTVDEARQKIVALGEAMKNPVESWLAQQRPLPPPAPPSPSWRRPLAATGIALGFATIVGGGALLANAKHDSKLWPAMGGVLIGVGASLAALSTYVLVVMPGDSPKALPKIALAGSF